MISVDFALTEEQQAVCDTARRALRKPVGRARAEQLGWFDAELTVLDRVLLAEECGRAGQPAPFLEEPLTAAGEALGIAAAAYEVALAHARERTQFGRPIGSFQAVAFPIVDGYVRVELARSSLWRAAASDEPASAVLAAAVRASALLETRQAAVANCELAIQVLGAYGLSAEGPLAGPYRRALALAAQPPTAAELRRSIKAGLRDDRRSQ